MADLAGINLAMQTPFGADGKIDFSEWDGLVDAYVDAGVHGLVLGSGTGQHPYLTEEECKALYEAAIKRIDGRCNAICQTSALNMDEVIRRSKHAEAAGADALMILPPYLEGPADDDGLFEFYRAIDAEVGIDIVGYNIPQATGLAVSPELFTRLSELKNFNYIKDSGGDLTTHQQYLQDGCRVLNGCDTTAVYAMMAGAHGCIWGGANYMPHETVALYKHVAAKEYDQALALWQKMLPSLLHIWTNDYLQCVLVAARHRGYGLGNVRRPLRPISDEAEAVMIATLAPLMDGET
ncbi:4-hydroxy-tetrahydrodipicolinate synthase [Roseovarius sp. THAF27]|uniref:dihydrodipicolinate synthase family protein n=1 Tax=Roseovarius sp. THAF27 TaxID=2587850 RepID=UPI001268B295|nr:dihydrodipicolinate synthase family protein [Roseovarius sp. THAF27]QFT81988.1 4-hydroxy-tetrahydrodipicolinate synthase [Roseovarius sp. THAF27]